MPLVYEMFFICNFLMPLSLQTIFTSYGIITYKLNWQFLHVTKQIQLGFDIDRMPLVYKRVYLQVIDLNGARYCSNLPSIPNVFLFYNLCNKYLKIQLGFYIFFFFFFFRNSFNLWYPFLMIVFFFFFFIRPRHQLVFSIGENLTKISYSIIKDFTGLTN